MKKISIRVWNFIGIIPGLYFPLYIYFRTKPVFQESYVFTVVSMVMLGLFFMLGKKVEERDELALKILERVNSRCFKILTGILALLIFLVMVNDVVTISYFVALTIPVIITIRAILFLLYDMRGMSE